MTECKTYYKYLINTDNNSILKHKNFLRKTLIIKNLGIINNVFFLILAVFCFVKTSLYLYNSDIQDDVDFFNKMVKSSSETDASEAFMKLNDLIKDYSIDSLATTEIIKLKYVLLSMENTQNYDSISRLLLQSSSLFIDSSTLEDLKQLKKYAFSNNVRIAKFLSIFINRYCSYMEKEYNDKYQIKYKRKAIVTKIERLTSDSLIVHLSSIKYLKDEFIRQAKKRYRLVLYNNDDTISISSSPFYSKNSYPQSTIKIKYFHERKDIVYEFK